MELQETAPLPLDPLEHSEEDYGSAVIHVAWDRVSGSNERTLLFAFVELLPAEIPPPVDDYDPRSPDTSHRLGGRSDHYVHIRHAVTTPREGLTWYLSCRAGNAALPPDEPSAERKVLRLAALGEDPRWPTLVSASDTSTIHPFVPQWIHCPRTHHLVPASAFDLESLWSPQERAEAESWLLDHLHFDIAHYIEYWGSVHLVAPNPVYRSMDSRLQPRGAGAESVLIRFTPRMGHSARGLMVAFREEDPWGITASRAIHVDRDVIRVNFAREVTSVASDVSDASRGVLEHAKQAHAFLKSIRMSFGFAHRLVVQTPSEKYEVMRTGKPEQTIIGGKDHQPPPARARLLTAHYARKQSQVAVTHGQKWFREQREEAKDLLRSVLTEASNELLVVDSYFAAEEMANFALAVGRSDVPIRILTSAEVLRTEAATAPPRERGQQLLDTLRQIASDPGMNPIEIRVMTGARPSIHDRFLVIDTRIWLLGSSLNEFGARGTMMVMLPDPDPVRDDLLKAWNDAVPLETWVENREEAKRKEGASGQ